MDSSPLRKNQKALSVAILRRGNLRRKMRLKRRWMRAQMTNTRVRFIIVSYMETIGNQKNNMFRSKCTLAPEESKKTAWDCIGFVFIVWQSISIPFTLAFSISSDGFYQIFDTVIDVFFILDISKSMDLLFQYLTANL